MSALRTPLLTEVRWFLSGVFLLLAEKVTPTTLAGLTVRSLIRKALDATPTN